MTTSAKTQQKEIEAELTSLYKRAVRRNRASGFLLADLHIHTPASKCYLRMNDNLDDDYKRLLNKLAESPVSIFAITDHNTLEGFFKIKEILQGDNELSALLSEKLIIPGVEITCYGKHFLVLFPENVTKDATSTFLWDCGIAIEEQGKEYASADRVSPLLLCENVEKYGGIVILAHCDAEHGLLQSYIKQEDNSSEDALEINGDDIRGNSIGKILSSSSVYGVCYNSQSNLERIKNLLSDMGGERLALLQASDSHSHLDKYNGAGLPVGTRGSWIKLGKKSFRALRLALSNSSFAVINEPPSPKDNPYIVGLCIRGGFVKDKDNAVEWATIPYSPELNCIIGARGTGKSTIMSILKFLLDKDNLELKHEVLSRDDSFDTAVVFLQNNNEVFAVRMEPKSLSNLRISYYRLKPDGGFVKANTSRGMNNGLKSLTKEMQASKYLTQTNIQSYAQKELFYLGNDEFGPAHIIETLCALQYTEEFRDNLRKIIKYRKTIPEECMKITKNRSKIDRRSDSSQYLEEAFSEYKKANENLQILKSKTIAYLNGLMEEKLCLRFYPFLLSEEDKGNMFDKWVMEERIRTNITYEKQLELKRKLNVRLIVK